MWLIPADFGPTHCVLPPGRYPVAGHHAPASVTLLATLLTRLLPDVEHHLELPWEALPLTPDHALHRAHRALVVVRAPAGVPESEVERRLAGLGGRYQLVQVAGRAVNGDGWQEPHLKEPILSLVRRNLGHPDHPLRALGIAALPVTFAARLTADTVELLELLDAAIAHRLTYAANGIGEEDYKQSLRVVAGGRLAQRLADLPPAACEAALEVLLAGPERLAQVPDLWTGSRALEQAGLARRVGGDLSLGPLARRLRTDPTLRGAFLDAAPPARFSERARGWLVAGERARFRRQGGDATSAERPDRRRGDRLWQELLDALAAELAHLESADLDALTPLLETCRALSMLPGYLERAPRVLRDQAAAALRGTDRFDDRAGPAGQLGRTLRALLRHQVGRGPRNRDARLASYAEAERSILADAPTALRLARATLGVECFWDRVATAVDRAELDAAETALRADEALAPKDSAAAAAISGAVAHLLARRGDIEGALALHTARLRQYTRWGAVREAALVRVRLARLHAGRGNIDQAFALHHEALEAFERLNEEHDRAVTLGDLARLRAARGEEAEARRLHEQRLSIFETLGARMGRAIALGDLARLDARAGHLDEALDKHRERLAILTDLGDVSGQAMVRGDLARLAAARGQYDEARAQHLDRLEIALARDDLDSAAVARLNLGQLERQRGHHEAALNELRAALALNRQLGHAEAIATTAEELGLLLRDLDQPEAADPLLNEAHGLYRQLGLYRRAAALTRRLSPRG